ncbi:nucleotidyltransferase domain-containing protein [Thermodesulfovibrio yellowstonii]|uniref:nucleotidyltransferase domain-containing protein n=1 Tax=Thermodesulfovibrio yellowstonii TaxID=28262 RepID=UPI0024B35D39|nr:nucleotidyltransferase domain-containing protein [Thermodesulfovibrio yellowstonii]MDI6865125.1 nucleotidyltransferase domain-containing protein [Thermodesulfovibrio yellowstonii]
MKITKGYKREYKKILKQLRDLCVNFYKNRLVSLVVFGSVAKGTFSPVSDIDLLIILKNKRTQYEEFSIYYDNIETKLFRGDFTVEINPIFKSYRELSVKTSYLWNTDFIVLYDTEDFFKNFLDKLQEFKNKALFIHTKPMEYIELVNGK